VKCDLEVGITMKRSHQEEVDDESEDTEMEVDGEEKAERSEDEDEEVEVEEEDEDTKAKQGTFLDTFYGLSSSDAQERAHASNALLHFCLIGPEANTKDAAYALRRLLNGLCSGRAAARQGNASAFAAFLKIAFQQGVILDIQRESLKDGEAETSPLTFVRRRLLAATESSDEGQGRKKGSEDRDYHFGRLFGILGVLRSGVLSLSGEVRADVDEIIAVSGGFVEDLAELYSYKKWMREPAAHAVGTLLNSFYALGPESTDAGRVVEHLVESVIVPKFLLSADSKSDDVEAFPISYSAEQLAIAVNIQSHVQFHPNGLPAPINKSVLTKETIPLIASTLSETSAVTQPRTHLVWDSIWLFITKSEDKQESKTIDTRKSRDRCPVGNESVHEVLEAIIQHVVVERLLGVDNREKEGKEAGKTTHDRRSLALCIIRNLLGVEFVSSIAGRTTLLLEPEIIESIILSPLLVRRVFIDVIGAGKGGKKKQAEHLLKPLAIQVLESMTGAMDLRDHSSSEDAASRRLAVARSLLKCDSRFDASTKTTTVARVLRLNELQLTTAMTKVWDEHIAFSERQVATCRSPDDEDKSAGVSSYEAAGYVDLLFHMGKHLLRVDPTSEPELIEYKAKTTQRLLGFLMTTAFFDCTSVDAAIASPEPRKSSSAKKKKGKKGAAKATHDVAIEVATTVKAQRSGTTSTIPYDVRNVLSARFFSFLAEIVGATVHTSGGSNKYSSILDLMCRLAQSWKLLESAGAKGFAAPMEDNDDGNSLEDLEGIVTDLQKAAQKLSGTEESTKNRFAVGCALLASTLYLHLLSCGQPSGPLEDENPDTDDEGDFEEISNCIADVKHIVELYSKGGSTEENPLFGLAELCVNILSSPIGSGNQSRGASPTLLREAVKFIWTGGLNLSAASSEENGIDSQVVALLLGSIGASDGDADADEEDMEEAEDESDSDDSDASEHSNDEAVFSKAAGVSGVLEDEEMNDASEDGSDKEGDEDPEEDMELDATRLQSMLEDDSDADVDGGELEHHAGADAALAQLIQLKQDARKAGKLARERMEIARQIRCTLLLETLVVGKPDGWGSLLRTDVVLQLVIPLLSYRKNLEKAISKGTRKGSESGVSEKRSLLERITSLLKTKIFKMKFSSIEWTESFDVSAFAAEYASTLITQAKDIVGTDHRSLCNSGLIAMLRAIPDTDQKLKAAEVYAEAVHEWATKRTSRLEVTLFDQLIHQSPVLAQAVLVESLSAAAVTARSNFLKSESFRLLSLLYNPKLNSNTSSLDNSAVQTLVKAADSVLESVVASVKDPEMKKTKRIREVLKTAEKVIAFLASSTVSNHALPSKRMSELAKSLDQVKDNSESQGVKSDCDKLQSAMKELLKKSPTVAMEEDPVDDDDAKEEAVSTKTEDAKSKQKQKKKPKKKKR
jgi:hypothetical protein